MPDMKPDNTSPQRVHLHAYNSLSKLCAEIQRGRYPTKADLARVVNRNPRTIQNYIRALRDDWQAPLEFDYEKKGFHFTDPAWRLQAIKLSCSGAGKSVWLKLSLILIRPAMRVNLSFMGSIEKDAEAL